MKRYEAADIAPEMFSMTFALIEEWHIPRDPGSSSRFIEQCPQVGLMVGFKPGFLSIAARCTLTIRLLTTQRPKFGGKVVSSPEITGIECVLGKILFDEFHMENCIILLLP